MVFHEITPGGDPRPPSPTHASSTTGLVDAQETRRILDRLYGYEVSPELWKKVLPRLSAGRVQSRLRRGCMVERGAGADGVPRRRRTGTSKQTSPSPSTR